MQIDKISTSGSFWQSSTWESILHDSGQTKDIDILSFGGDGIMVEYRPIGMGMLWAFSLGVDDLEVSHDFIEYCKKNIRARGAIIWQIETYHPRGIDPLNIKLETYGRHFLEPWTRTIDLARDEDDLMKEMHEKWRYNIRLAWKRGVTTQWVTPTVENIDIWMRLLWETTERDNFSQNSREYYISFLRNISGANSWGLLFALYEGQVIAAGIFVYHHNVAIYYYGASTSDPEMRKHMAPYMLQWEALREGKNRGCHTYDFLGIAPPGDDLHHLAGVSSFKEKFGGRAIMIGPKNLFVLAPVRYFFFRMIRWVRKIFRRK